MRDWVTLLTAITNLITAIIILSTKREDNKKGTKRKPGGKRK
ncbi:hypothetical protein [Paenibacillus motobuensis]|uniref:Phage holin n=1 Tax=Paenibacillus motobuensis TaxID=295324 RepID=A0ABP3HKP8_9BACL